MTNKPLLTIAMLLTAAVSAACIDLSGTDEPTDDGGPTATPVTDPAHPLSAFLEAIPDADVPELDLQTALSLVAMPLSCLDRPHAEPRDRSTYLDEIVTARRPGYERDRAFYGCWDWHSAVNSTWALVRIHKEFPELPVAGLVREKLNAHLSRTALAGELEFFEDNRTFERPYGWSWLLVLYAELRTWDHPDAVRWADNVQPLAEMFSQRSVRWLTNLDRPSRSGTHSNTAFALAMMLDYARRTGDAALGEAVVAAAVRLFVDDTDCPTAYEPWAADFLSPCLEEAALMAEVLEPGDFLPWFERFLPAVDSRKFLPLTTPIDTSERPLEGPVAQPPAEVADASAPPAATGRPPDTTAEVPPGDAATEASPGDEDLPTPEEIQRGLGSRSHLIGLAFIRADAMNRIAAALPPADPRVATFRRLAAHHGAAGFEAMFDAEYAGSHWIGTFALKYLLTERR